MAAIQCSIDAGVDMIEIDVQRTKDGRLILMHDVTVDRMTNGSGLIADLTLEDIRAHRLKQGQGGEGALVTEHVVPTLDEAMQLVKNKVLVNLDKCWKHREEVYRVLVQTGTVKQTLFKSAADFAEVEMFLAGKAERPEYMQMIKPGNQHLLERLDEFVASAMPRAFELLFPEDDSAIVSFDTIRRLEGRCRIWVNTMWGSLCGGHTDERSLSDPQSGWEWHLRRGFNMIQTDYPVELVRYLRNREAAPASDQHR